MDRHVIYGALGGAVLSLALPDFGSPWRIVRSLFLILGVELLIRGAA